MLTIDPKTVSTAEFHGYLLGAVAPRPIAFASTVDKAGNVNLSPFSFFNAFSANPPVLIFSPARRVRDNTTKHTLDNVLEVPEVVINIVNYNMVQQMSLASTEYDHGVNEFEKAGFHEIASQKIKPPRVAESPASFECKVNDVIALGNEGGAGNLIICEVVMAHFDDAIFDKTGKIHPANLDAVARMGGNWYSRANGDSLFEVPKPLTTKGIGVDSLPVEVRLSHVLSGNDLGQLGNVERLPSQNEVEEFASEPEVSAILENFNDNSIEIENELHKLAKNFLEEGEVEKALKVLFQTQYM